ncbi:MULTISPECIES: GNAT family N-acetyltransferase [unclassified Janthinobacterium]|uniref:GNAT family N-acetyltransferase n=1 Tax=unclassified Janthinobacterium TaxID=2610881 RepID=UPI001607DEA7|nr:MULTISPECIES: GNAT family protein [unclassified Janthinobacterium]MBB5369546.1 RimJ/RimL family protein N-acetyltransferase [Janthinobacterium sp. K2C7]MBB5382498.1 RimJ/RimL family protein N-acetyltransferase [Janthinobacterium sp. K2Li3]MBB5388075.1 RimJ/RimL family protein N-acetyltransferase [Janthinobacterium sp. K2E3]
MPAPSLPPCNHPLVEIRPLLAADIPHWYAYLREAEVIRHTSWQLRDIHDLYALFNSYQIEGPETPLRFAIAERCADGSTGRLIGTVGFNQRSVQHRQAEIAYDLAPAWWGRGIATAICLAACEWALQSQRCLRVQACVLDTNAASIRVLEKAGFEREGWLRSYRVVRGLPGNFFMYARVAA